MEGNGSFTFIPCPGFCGTIFVNMIAQILSTMGSQADVEVEGLNGVKIKRTLGFNGYKSENGKMITSLGTIAFG